MNFKEEKLIKFEAEFRWLENEYSERNEVHAFISQLLDEYKAKVLEVVQSRIADDRTYNSSDDALSKVVEDITNL
jgi:hypothetical protein